MLPLGTTLPAFRLYDLDGRSVSSDDLRGARGVLVAFICPHCPFVKHIRQEFAAFAREYAARGLAVVAINSNDIAAFPQDGADGMRDEARSTGYSFPYMLDERQDVAKAFHAACTPDFFLFDAAGSLAYRGQFDDSRPGNGLAVTGADLRAAADAVLAGRPADWAQKPSVGCNIKWKRGSEPNYAQS
jgi:thiol-disulfide isomerase/thioredoxin